MHCLKLTYERIIQVHPRTICISYVQRMTGQSIEFGSLSQQMNCGQVCWPTAMEL